MSDTTDVSGRTNEWVANPLGPGQTSAQQINTRSTFICNTRFIVYIDGCRGINS